MNTKTDIRQFERGIRVCVALVNGETLTTREMMARFGVSRAQAKRDLSVAERTLANVVRVLGRTYIDFELQNEGAPA